jgi:serine phosphatase RsbU (regulator of sigma subunit)
VVGHDVTAAAAMGQLRSMLRTIAAHSGAGPADVLRGVDTTMHPLQVPLTATAVVARIDIVARETARLRWSSAGHPPGVILHADGTTAELRIPAPDLLLGLDPSLARTEANLPLEAGATLLLYTDGLIERHDQPLDEGLALLHRTLSELGGPARPVDELCDQLLARMLPAHTEDDVALIAVRLAPCLL